MGSKALISGIDLNVDSGEMLAVLGPNGAGKSSLLKVMAGEYSHYTGEMTLGGRDYYSFDPKERAKFLGILPQSSQLAFSFSVFEVVSLGRLPHSTGNVIDREIVYQALIQADVAYLAHALYPSLSGGEKQRVQFARVLCQIWQHSESGQGYLLLDEPTSALDLSHQHQTLSQAKALASKGVAVLCILHDVNLAAQYADKIVLLNKGKITAAGRVTEILTSSNIAGLYGIEVSVMAHPKGDYPLVVAL
jgi:iron complex transport system ATP-binding protein